MNIRVVLTLLFTLILKINVNAQCLNEDIDDINQVKIKSFAESVNTIVAPNWDGLRPGDLLGTRLFIPLSVNNTNQKDRFLVQSSSANTWNPSVPIQGIRFYQADGVVRTITLKYEKYISKTDQIWLNVNAFVLNKGRTIVDDMFFTSDRSIEKVHTIIGQENPFGRKNYEFDTANFIVRDEKGNETVLKAGDSILNRFDFGYIKKIELINNNSNIVTLSLGQANSLPLSKMDSRIMVGASQQLIETKKISKNNSISVVLNASQTKALTGPIYKNSTQFDDHSKDYGYGLAILFAHVGKKEGVTTYGVEVMRESPPLQHAGKVKMPDLNDRVSGLHGGELPTQLALKHDTELFGFGVNHTTKNGISFQTKMAEDLNFHKGWMLGGSTNRQDFSFYMTVSASSEALKNLFIKKHPTIQLND